MKIDVTQEKLARALSAASRVASAKSGLPVLGNILLRTDGKQLYIAATNLEVAITERLGAKIESTGSITAPAKLISDFVSNLPKDNVHIEVVKSKIHITSDHYSSTINGVSDEEFPELPRVESKNAVQFSLTVDDFKEAASQTIIAASSDSTRPVLTGIYVHTYEGDLYFAATDGYRLAEKKIVSVSSEVAAIVPVSTIQEVLRMINEDIDQIDILLDDTQVTFTLGTAEVTSRLIDGNFPDYRQLIPKKNMTKCNILVDDLKRIVKLAALFARETNGGIKLIIDTDKNTLSINSIASELGENTSELNVEASGDTAAITLNSRYLNDVLNVISSDHIILGYSGKLTPCVVEPVTKNPDYKHIIMPIKS
jgi:DNA polymerase-3 subunit beta